MQWGPVAFGIATAVVGFQKGPMVLCILVDELLDVPVQQLDGRVERVFSAARGSSVRRDVGSHKYGERAAVIPDITRGDVVSSCIAEDLPEDFFPGRTGGW